MAGLMWRPGVALLAAVLAGCYAYTPLATLSPAPATYVSLQLTDQGRVGAGPTLGYGLDRIEGTLVRATDSSYVVRVAGVTDVRGARSKWSGEEVSVQRAWVGNAGERRFSRSRTYLTAGALGAGIAAFIATRTLGRGGGILQTGGGGGGDNQ